MKLELSDFYGGTEFESKAIGALDYADELINQLQNGKPTWANDVVYELRASIALCRSLVEDALKLEIDSDSPTVIEYYEEMLNELSEVRIGSLTYSPAYVLKKVDPTAYRCGLVDYVDTLYGDAAVGIGRIECEELTDLEERLTSTIEELLQWLEQLTEVNQ